MNVQPLIKRNRIKLQKDYIVLCKNERPMKFL